MKFILHRNTFFLPVLQETLIYEILSLVEEIPEGCVATYGQITDCRHFGNPSPFPQGPVSSLY